MKITEHNYTSIETEHNEYIVKGELTISNAIHIEYEMKYVSLPSEEPSSEITYNTTTTLISFKATVNDGDNDVTLLVDEKELKDLLENHIKL